VRGVLVGRPLIDLDRDLDEPVVPRDPNSQANERQRLKEVTVSLTEERLESWCRTGICEGIGRLSLRGWLHEVRQLPTATSPERLAHEAGGQAVDDGETDPAMLAVDRVGTPHPQATVPTDAHPSCHCRQARDSAFSR
jgi:hypothetical protein